MATSTISYYEQPLTIVKGDSDEILTTVTEPDTASTVVPPPQIPINLTEAVDGTVGRYAILRTAAKRKGTDDLNAYALYYKDSQKGDSDIAFLNQATNEGEAEILIDAADTTDSDEPMVERGEAALHDYDLEANRQHVERAGASQVGTVSVVNGSNVIEGVGTRFDLAKVEDIINLTDVDNLTMPALITKIVSATEIQVGRSLWVNASAVTFEIRRNKRRTVAGGDVFFVRERVSKL